jgi:hypothetical protein
MPLQKNNKRSYNRRRVRINLDGSANQEDMEHNRKCEKKYMKIDNPWMDGVLNNKNPKGYDKYLKQIVKKRIETLNL